MKIQAWCNSIIKKKEQLWTPIRKRKKERSSVRTLPVYEEGNFKRDSW